MLYLLRHGTTDWNKMRKLQGRSDVPLNDEGRELARKAAKECADVHFDVCYSSPLVRAKETAEIFLEGRDVPIYYDDRLQEMYFGEYEGLENCLERPDKPEIHALFKEPEKYFGAPGGAETFDDLFARTGAFLDEVVYPLLEQGKDVLIVGHGAMNSSIVSRIRNYSRADFWKAGIEKCRLMRVI